jgi:hypothetical protein
VSTPAGREAGSRTPAEPATEREARLAEGGELPSSVPLTCQFDASRLAAEAHELRSVPWGAQRSYGSGGLSGESESDWQILPLRSLGGDKERTDPGGAGLLPFADTHWLRRCAYLREVLGHVPAPLRAVRLMSLGSGARVEEHRDGKCGLPYGRLRLHVPVVTNPGALVVISGSARHWDCGRLWYGDFNQPHYVCNDGPQPRIHLVIDTLVTAALMALFPESFTASLAASQVLLARDPVDLRPSERAGFRCRFALPEGFADWSEDELESPWGQDVPAAVEPAGGGLVLSVSGRPQFGLVHLGAGEFRLQGWSEERTLHLDPGGSSVAASGGGRGWVRFCVRRGQSRRETTRPLR